MSFEILKETEKAVFIRVPEEDKELWMPKSLIKKDGNLSKKAEDIVAAEDTNEVKKMKKEGVFVDFSKADVETEKAYGFNVDFIYKNPTSDKDGEVRFTKTFYFAKSQIKDGKVPYWMHHNAVMDIFFIEKKYSGSCLDGYRGHIEAGAINF